MSNAHMNIHHTGDNFNKTRGKKFRDIITPLFGKQIDKESNSRYGISR